MLRTVLLTLLLLTACTETPPREDFNGTDHAWMQLMIPMNEQLLPLLDLARDRAVDPSLRERAMQIRGSHMAELESLRRLRDLAGLPPGNVHAGHSMPGLVSEAELAAIGKASRADFDRLYSASLRVHLEQTEQLARSEQQAGANGGCKALAAAIAEVRLDQLRELSKSALQAPSI